MEKNPRGYLIIIGGAEDKTGGSGVLKQAPQMMSEGESLTIITTATEHPEQAGETYERVFRALGVKIIQILNMNTRDAANEEESLQKIKHSRCVFLTGGDQLRITSILGGTAACRELRTLYANGGVVMGTSAGASVMSSTMIVNGADHEPAKKCTLKMAPGLGFVTDVIIDQHFDQRGRFGRLLCGVAENPGVLGIGIDEDTAVKLYPDMHFEVIGANAVTILDGTRLQSSNVSELKQDEILAVTGVAVHVLPWGYGFDLRSRKVLRLKNETGSNQNM